MRSTSARHSGWGGSRATTTETAIMLSLSQAQIVCSHLAGSESHNVGFARASQTFKTVSTLKHRNQPAGAMPVGKFQHQQSEVAKVIVSEQKLAERIVDARIEPSREQDQVGIEGRGSGHEQFAESCRNFRLARTGRKRTVDGFTGPRA